jgi:simple sugar transport system permease protein
MGWEMWIITTLSRTLAYGTPLLLGTLGESALECSTLVSRG